MKWLKKYRKIVFVSLSLTIVLTSSKISTLANQGNYKNNNQYSQNEVYSGNELKSVPENQLSDSKVKSKLNSKLLQLTGRQAILTDKPQEVIKDEMKSLNQFMPSGGYVKNIQSKAPSDVVYVYIKTKSSNGTKVISPYVYKIVNEDMDNKILTAWVEVNNLKQLESLDEVVKVDTVIQPKVNYASEGDQLHRADLIRSLDYGSKGAGIKVGVISDGVDHLSESVSKGALSSNITVLSNKVGGDEGTAMLEIVHALAPEASLYFHDSGTDMIAFNQAVDRLVAAGCNVIVDDIGWITEPFFEDGIVASHIKEVINQKGIIYVSAAGNEAKNHYIGLYHNDGNNFHDFSSGKESVYKSMYVYIEPGDTVEMVLQWDDPFNNSTNDYDLFLWNVNGSMLDVSSYYQHGSGTSPIEYIEYTNNTGSPMDAIIDIRNFGGVAQPRTLNLYVYGQVYENNIVSSSSIFGHAALSEVITTGAIDVSSPNQIASYSSQGPVLFRNVVIRQKPDIIGAAGVTVTGAGGFPTNFKGTSAAAPHIAAIAALLWSKNPTMTNAQVRELIVNNSLDLGTSGYDNVYGHGRADTYIAFMSRFEGDFSNNGIIDVLDLQAAKGKLNVNNTDSANWKPSMDINKDGIIDIYDLVIISNKIK